MDLLERSSLLEGAERRTGRDGGGRHLPPGTALRDQRRWKVFAPIAVVVFLANAVLWLLRGSGLVH